MYIVHENLDRDYIEKRKGSYNMTSGLPFKEPRMSTPSSSPLDFPILLWCYTLNPLLDTIGHDT